MTNLNISFSLSLQLPLAPAAAVVALPLEKRPFFRNVSRTEVRLRRRRASSLSPSRARPPGRSNAESGRKWHVSLSTVVASEPPLPSLFCFFFHCPLDSSGRCSLHAFTSFVRRVRFFAFFCSSVVVARRMRTHAQRAWPRVDFRIGARLSLGGRRRLLSVSSKPALLIRTNRR